MERFRAFQLPFSATASEFLLYAVNGAANVERRKEVASYTPVQEPEEVRRNPEKTDDFFSDRYTFDTFDVTAKAMRLSGDFRTAAEGIQAPDSQRLGIDSIDTNKNRFIGRFTLEVVFGEPASFGPAVFALLSWKHRDFEGWLGRPWFRPNYNDTSQEHERGFPWELVRAWTRLCIASLNRSLIADHRHASGPCI